MGKVCSSTRRRCVSGQPDRSPCFHILLREQCVGDRHLQVEGRWGGHSVSGPLFIFLPPPSLQWYFSAFMPQFLTHRGIFTFFLRQTSAHCSPGIALASFLTVSFVYSRAGVSTKPTESIHSFQWRRLWKHLKCRRFWALRCMCSSFDTCHASALTWYTQEIWIISTSMSRCEWDTTASATPRPHRHIHTLKEWMKWFQAHVIFFISIPEVATKKQKKKSKTAASGPYNTLMVSTSRATPPGGPGSM